MNRKRLASIILSTVVSCSVLSTSVVYAQDDSGKIDLYEVFSSKEDRMKTEVGSRVYKWSMHLPDDGIIYKSDKANYFNMYSTSYSAAIELQVEKNKDDLTLEEVLYKLQNRKSNEDYYFYFGGDKEYVTDIATDESGQKYIKIVKTDEFYDYYLVNDAAAEMSSYIENRIYVANNYIYNLTVSMDGKYYKQHEEMFNKLTSSFKLSFDEKNPYIKELSDSISTTREFTNTSYGWKLTMSPYWRVNGIPNARNQKFSPVYSDEELNDKKSIKGDTDSDSFIEGISVKVVSSASEGETAASWGEGELNLIKSNYNSGVYEILRSESGKLGDLDVYHLETLYETVTDAPYVVHNMYVIGNGYKYLISATIKEEKYSNASKKKEFDNMINSFTLDKAALNKYLGKLISADSLINTNDPKNFAMKKYDFAAKLTKSWSTPGSDYDYYSRYYGIEFYSSYKRNVSNNESLKATDGISNISVVMDAGLDTNKMDDAINLRAAALLEDNEVRMGLAKVRIQLAEFGEVQICYIEKEYDLSALNNFVKNDKTKRYDLTNLQNEYEHIIKIGTDTYTQSVTLPVANSTTKNKEKAMNVWKNTTIKGVNYSIYGMTWSNLDLKDFDESSSK